MFVSNGSVVTKTPILPRLDSTYFPYMPGMSSGTWPSAYSAIYRSHLWVKVVVEKRAKALARLPLPVYKREDQDRPRDDEHPLAVLLRQPNPRMSPFDLWEWTSSTYDIWGDSFWYKYRDPRAPAGMWIYPLNPGGMAFDASADRWSFDNGKLKLPDIKREDLVHFKTFNPESLARGMSPLEPLRATLENEWAARTATSSFWRRGARPGTYLIHPKNLSEPAQARLKKQVDEAMSGPHNTGSTMLLEEGLEPRAMTLSAEEAQYIETRKLNREEVCAAYDMPPPAVHILDRATFSNITEQFRSVYRDTMAPICADFEATIETDLRQVDWPSDDVYAEFLMDEVLRGDFETRQDALAKASHMTLAEKRKIENLPFIDGTDRIFLNAAEVPLPPPADGDAPPPPPFQQVGLPALIEAGVIDREDARRLLGIDGTPPAKPDAPSPAAVSESVVRTIIGRLSRPDTLADVDPSALSDGLGDAAVVLVNKAFVRECAADGDVPGLRKRIQELAKESAA